MSVTDGAGAGRTARAGGQREAEPTQHLEAHEALGQTLFHMGEYVAARTHLVEGITLTDPTIPRAQALRLGEAPGPRCLVEAALTLWCLGFPAQAVWQSEEALALAQALAHPYTLAVIRHWAAMLHQRRRDAPAVQAQADALLTLATVQGFPFLVALGCCQQGWALVMQDQSEPGLAQLRQGLEAMVTLKQERARPTYVLQLADANGHVGQAEEGWHLLAEDLTAFEANGQGDLLAEAYRLQDALLLRQAAPDAAQVEACFQQALAIARRQQAKSWELRASVSLSRLWQQGKGVEARQRLAEVYGWFTEAFDTVDLREAQALLEELS